jgi:hypothetical protein
LKIWLVEVFQSRKLPAKNYWHDNIVRNFSCKMTPFQLEQIYLFLQHKTSSTHNDVTSDIFISISKIFLITTTKIIMIQLLRWFIKEKLLILIKILSSLLIKRYIHTIPIYFCINQFGATIIIIWFVVDTTNKKISCIRALEWIELSKKYFLNSDN